MEKYSFVKVREIEEPQIVRITSDVKPEPDSQIIEKWQSVIDLVAKIAAVPSGLIMRLNEKTIEVFLRSSSNGNPYERGEQAELLHGLYCETVIGTQKELLVPDATKDPVWREDNPDIGINMISYLGFPINWPDGECFGTVCLLDNKENHFNADFKNLLFQIKQHIEADLQMLIKNKDLEEKKVLLEQLNSIKTRFLSLISHDIRGSIGTLDEFLKLIVADFDSFDKADLLPMLKTLSSNASTSHQALDNLLTWSKNDLISFTPDIISINIIDIIGKALSSFSHEISVKGLTVHKDYYADQAIIHADEKMMYIIIRNLLSNAVKYSLKNGNISIRVHLKENKHIIEIEDAGIGMNRSLIANLFSYDKAHAVQGTNGESSAGIGLMLVKEFLDKNNALLHVQSEPGEGTVFRIEI